MLLSKPQPSPIQIDKPENIRARRVWLLVDILFLTWGFFYLFLWLRGHQTAATVCQFEALCYVVIHVLLRKSQKFITVMNLYLICGALGVFLVSVSDPKLAYATFFLPVSILVASCVQGLRQASFWFVASLLHSVAYFVYVYGFQETLTNHCDALALSLGVSSCVFFCCQQAESSFQSQTQSLIDFSSALQNRSDELERLATTDSLTGLTNRFQFQNKLEEVVELASDQHKVALFLIDMDGFKEVNDTLGHATGDHILVEIGERLSATIGPRASVARLGGDEFCVLLSDVSSNETADQLAWEIVELLARRRYNIRENEITLDTSVGYAICPDHAQSSKHLLSFADTAMYHAKNANQNVARYQSEMTELISANRLMNEQLAEAIENEEFHLVYQPQLDTTTNEIVGAEALMRWTHNGTTISPGRFVPLLEETGRIVEVSKWLVHEACRQQAHWRQLGHDLCVSVNISALQFRDEGFVDSVVDPLQEFGVAPEKLELEITEGILIENIEQVTEKLNHLKSLGCRISIDDFGTGYSSLAYLKQFPLDKLKIDRAFVKDIPTGDDGLIATGIIVLAKLLELEVIAEGVETIEQLEFLRHHGCNLIQGYYYSPPVDPAEIASMLKPASRTLVPS